MPESRLAWIEVSSAHCFGRASLSLVLLSLAMGSSLTCAREGSEGGGGAVHTLGSANGMTIESTGQIKGSSTSGSFRRSDGCVGHRTAYKL